MNDAFPKLEPLTVAPVTDLLIVVNGFEERSTRYASLLAGGSANVVEAVVLKFATNRDDNEAQMTDLTVSLQQLSTRMTTIDVADLSSKLAPSVRAAAERSENDGGRLRLTFDVSGASGRIILRVMRCLFELAREGISINLTVAYTEATEYAPTQADAENILNQLRARAELLKGVSPSAPIAVGPDYDADSSGADVEYIGQSAEGLPEHAVVICGFNANRVRVALDAVDPAFNADVPHRGVTYIAGEPPAKDLAWRLTVMKQINAYPEEPAAFDFHDASTLHYMETLDRLEKAYNEGFGKQRLTVIPFGSKMQTLAAALFCELHPDVRAQLVAPKRYQGSDYSRGSGPTHLLRFGDLTGLTARMSTLGSLRFQTGGGLLTGWDETEMV